MTSPLTKEEILNELERYDQATYHFFIDLEHPYFHTASSKLILFADKERWVIVFEKSGYANRGYRAEIELTYFGNCLINMQAEGSEEGLTSNSKTVVLIDNEEILRIENDQDELVAKNIKQVKVRTTVVDIQHNKEIYRQKGITDSVYDNPENLIDFPSLIRYLAEQHTELFSATDNELRKSLPADIPKLMEIKEWHHQSYYREYGVKPSEYETYKLIADILISKDTSKWKPTLKPNTNWRNWPRAGYM